MDIPRKEAAAKRRIRRISYAAVAVGVIVLTSVGVSRLKPAAPLVERATVVVDVVKRGPMIIQVRGLGTLVPEEIRWIPASTDGRVERRVLPGTPVKANTVILELSDPVLQQNYVDTEYQLKAGQADYDSLKVRLESTLLDQRAAAATVQADFHNAKLQAEVDQKLAKDGLGSDLKAELSKAKAEELSTRNEIEQKRLSIQADSERAQLAAQKAKVEQLRALFNLKKTQVDSLRVRAGIDGVLQLVPVEIGQRVAAGTNLARVANQTKLKAEIKISETQAKDIQIGQPAAVDTHNGVIPGHVIRIDPAVINGTRTVDVKLDGALPNGAVPDLSVDGTIELEHLEDVLYVGRPAFGQPNSTISLFKLDPDEKGAGKIQVKVGRTSVTTIELQGGLKMGDEVILSDMSRWDSFDRVRLD